MTNKNESIMDLIPIFKGKKGLYNRLILEILAEAGEPLKPWEIAKRIYEKSLKKATDWYHGTQKIYGTIIRKGGRLEELNKKDYIRFREGKWDLTGKGLIAVLLANPNLKSKVKVETRRIFQMMFQLLPKENEMIADIPIQVGIFGIKLKTSVAKLRKLFETAINLITENGEYLIEFLIRETEGLIRNGLDLDRINTQDLTSMLCIKRLLFTDEQFIQLLQRAINHTVENKSEKENDCAGLSFILDLDRGLHEKHSTKSSQKSSLK